MATEQMTPVDTGTRLPTPAKQSGKLAFVAKFLVPAALVLAAAVLVLWIKYSKPVSAYVRDRAYGVLRDRFDADVQFGASTSTCFPRSEYPAAILSSGSAAVQTFPL
jgi:hypothetical protein